MLWCSISLGIGNTAAIAAMALLPMLLGINV